MFLAKPYKISSKTRQRAIHSMLTFLQEVMNVISGFILLQSGSKITSMLKKSWSERKPDVVSV